MIAVAVTWIRRSDPVSLFNERVDVIGSTIELRVLGVGILVGTGTGPIVIRRDAEFEGVGPPGPMGCKVDERGEGGGYRGATIRTRRER